MDEGGAPTLEALEPFVGEWDLQPTFSFPVPDDVTGRATFEWMPGGRFLVQRWEVSHPDAPDGIAIIGPDDSGEAFLQHYFDSRGVARVYQMGFTDGVWTLSRTTPDFSPLDFMQRYSGSFSDDGNGIEGTWEICEDGVTWEKDFDLVYRRMS
jgi:Protein of unknown function (DUF1579)